MGAYIVRCERVEKNADGHYVLTVEIEDSLLLDGWINTWRGPAGIIRVDKTVLS